MELCEFRSEDFGHCDLQLDLVKIQDDMTIFSKFKIKGVCLYSILEHISRILNLNAKSLLLMLDIASEFDNCVAKFTRNKYYSQLFL